MLTANGHKNFTSCGDKDAEALLEKVLSEMKELLSGTGLCIVLGGSYGRGDGGVRQDRENGILYNDLDFFAFAREKSGNADRLLKDISRKYEDLLKVDVDFSRVMSAADIQNNAPRLMMQELKRGYRLVCGEDLLEKYLPEYPAEALPFYEACRLLLNRGMGLYLAGEKIAKKSADTDFILRNLYKAILGTADAMMIASGQYRWKLTDRLAYFESLDLREEWKAFYREAVAFKHSPHREKKADMAAFWNEVRDFYRAGVLMCSGGEEKELRNSIYRRCRAQGEVSLKNYAKYMIKSRSLPLKHWQRYTAPAVAVLLPDLYDALTVMPAALDEHGKLYRHWLIFN